MAYEIPVTQARAEFAELVNRVVYGGERVVLTRHGKPLVALVPADELERLDSADASDADDAGGAGGGRIVRLGSDAPGVGAPAAGPPPRRLDIAAERRLPGADRP